MLTWFITGASRGLGREVALNALRRGDRVVATARSVEAVEGLREFGADRVLTLELDVTRPEQVEQAVRRAEQRFGAVDVLCNNAGIGYFAAVEESDDAEVRRMMETNVFGLAAVVNAALPGMRARRSGVIVNISSISADQGYPYTAVYAASKAAVAAFTEGLNVELADFGELDRATPAARDAAVRAALERYVATLEALCREAPYNWFNFYDFWADAKASPIADAAG